MSADKLPFDSLAALLNIFEVQRALSLFIALFILFMGTRFIKKLSLKFSERHRDQKKIFLQGTSIFCFFLNVVGGLYLIVLIFNPPRELIIGLLGGSIFLTGFAVKDMVASLVSGITLIIDPPFQVGDRVRFKDACGDVINIGLRSVRIKTLSNQIITIPNSKFLEDIVICANSGNIFMPVITHFYVGLSADIAHIKNILTEVVLTSRYTYLEHPPEIVIETKFFGEIFCYHLALQASVLDSKFEKDFETDIYSRVNQVFLREGIPLPQKEILLCEDVNLFSRKNRDQYQL